jgi:hypothetical protein
VSGAITDVRLMTKCCPIKNTRNKPERAIATFRAIEEDNIPILVYLIIDIAKIQLKKMNAKNKNLYFTYLD